MRLPARLAKLEAVHRNNRVVVMFQHETETGEEAKARWRAQHPGEDLEGAGLTVIIMRWCNPQPETPQ